MGKSIQNTETKSESPIAKLEDLVGQIQHSPDYYEEEKSAREANKCDQQYPTEAITDFNVCYKNVHLIQVA